MWRVWMVWIHSRRKTKMMGKIFFPRSLFLHFHLEERKWWIFFLSSSLIPSCYLHECCTKLEFQVPISIFLYFKLETGLCRISWLHVFVVRTTTWSSEIMSAVWVMPTCPCSQKTPLNRVHTAHVWIKWASRYYIHTQYIRINVFMVVNNKRAQAYLFFSCYAFSPPTTVLSVLCMEMRKAGPLLFVWSHFPRAFQFVSGPQNLGLTKHIPRASWLAWHEKWLKYSIWGRSTRELRKLRGWNYSVFIFPTNHSPWETMENHSR